jgi:hypothetical protein
MMISLVLVCSSFLAPSSTPRALPTRVAVRMAAADPLIEQGEACLASGCTDSETAALLSGLNDRCAREGGAARAVRAQTHDSPASLHSPRPRILSRRVQLQRELNYVVATIARLEMANKMTSGKATKERSVVEDIVRDAMSLFKKSNNDYPELPEALGYSLSPKK